MSVINKVLRDLDRRQAPTSSGGGVSALAGKGMVSLPTAAVPQNLPAPAWRLWVLVGLAVLVALSAGLWMWRSSAVALAPTAVPGASSQGVPAASVPVEGLSGSASAPSVPGAAPPLPEKKAAAALPVPPENPKTALAAVNASMVLRMDSSLKLRKWMEAEPAVALSQPVSAPTQTKVEPAQRPVPVQTSVSSATSPAAPMDAAVAAQRQQQAAKEALAHAQSLWNSGAHDAAIELVQEMVATAERSVGSNPAAAQMPLLLASVRELTRMLLAESRPAPVWDLLTRLEPVLGTQADLWAVRANAAQRLGRHQDSVHAYMVALQSRPNEQRWLLGAAVSLAALGQTASAAEMADKARALAPITREVQAYLRQAGVQLQDR